MLEHLCPCCGRHCYLDEAQCERGIEYIKTGVIPSRKPRNNGEVYKHSEKKLKYLALDRIGRIAFSIEEMSDRITILSESLSQDQMFACLKEDDQKNLLILLERVNNSWNKLIKDKNVN